MCPVKADVIQITPTLSPGSEIGLIYKVQLGFKLESLWIRFVIFECRKLLCKKWIDSQISDPNCHWGGGREVGAVVFQNSFFLAK